MAVNVECKLEFFENDKAAKRNFIENVDERFSDLVLNNSIDEKESELVRLLNEIAASEIPVKTSNQNNPLWRIDPELREQFNIIQIYFLQLNILPEAIPACSFSFL